MRYWKSRFEHIDQYLLDNHLNRSTCMAFRYFSVDTTSLQRRCDVVQSQMISHRHWNDVVCLEGSTKLKSWLWISKAIFVKLWSYSFPLLMPKYLTEWDTSSMCNQIEVNCIWARVELEASKHFFIFSKILLNF